MSPFIVHSANYYNTYVSCQYDILTEFSQKTEMDPLPDFRKQIYKVGDGGKLVLIYDKQQKRYSGKWVDTN